MTTTEGNALRKMMLALVVLLGVAGVGRAGEKDIAKRIKAAGGDVVFPEEENLAIAMQRTRYSHLGVVVRMPRHFEEELLGELCEIRRLAVLSFPGAQVSDEGLRTLSELRGLILLGLDGTPVSDSGLRHIEKLTNLRGLYLRNCPNVSEMFHPHYPSSASLYHGWRAA
jgi:hypothetical protein